MFMVFKVRSLELRSNNGNVGHPRKESASGEGSGVDVERRSLKSVSISSEGATEERSESIYEGGRESFLVVGDVLLSLSTLFLWVGALVILLLELCRVMPTVVRLLPCPPRSLDVGYTH